jgi:sec-independent protein translocase protein TatA
MPNIGPLEIAVVLIIALIVFGPKRVPELGRSMGRGIREFRSSISAQDDDEDKTPQIASGPETSGPVEGEVAGAHRP